MALADDLLKDAYHLASRGGRNPKQSSLRRAVSTAYYALFHLLVGEFVLNWKRPDQRVRLGRMFKHKNMVDAKFKTANATPAVEADLKKVIDAFGQLQEDRHTADYYFGRNWSRLDVNNALAIASEAFMAWRNIRKDKIAQDHLLTCSALAGIEPPLHRLGEKPEFAHEWNSSLRINRHDG